jgi:hypothetical protein
VQLDRYGVTALTVTHISPWLSAAATGLPPPIGLDGDGTRPVSEFCPLRPGRLPDHPTQNREQG